MSDEYDSTDDCPACGADSGVRASLSTLLEDHACKACGVALEVEHEESYDDCACWLVVKA